MSLSCFHSSVSFSSTKWTTQSWCQGSSQETLKDKQTHRDVNVTKICLGLSNGVNVAMHLSREKTRERMSSTNDDHADGVVMKGRHYTNKEWHRDSWTQTKNDWRDDESKTNDVTKMQGLGRTSYDTFFVWLKKQKGGLKPRLVLEDACFSCNSSWWSRHFLQVNQQSGKNLFSDIRSTKESFLSWNVVIFLSLTLLTRRSILL